MVPGIFVRSQLSRIPGEERKFRRRRIVALIPVCRRERETAASQAVTAGVSSIGVVVESTTATTVSVDICNAGVVVGLVSVGEGVAAAAGASVPVFVGEGGESVGVDSVGGVS